MKCYFTFGQIHAHRVSGQTLDKDCVAEMTADSLMDGHNKGMELFNEQFHHCTSEPPDMSYYPRGIINID